MLEDFFRINVLATGMAAWEHNQATVKDFACISAELEAGRNTFGVFSVVFNTTVLEVDFLHDFPSGLIK